MKKKYDEQLLPVKYTGRRRLFNQGFNKKRYSFSPGKILLIPKKLFQLLMKYKRTYFDIVTIEEYNKQNEVKIQKTEIIIEPIPVVEENQDSNNDLNPCVKCGELFKNLGSHYRFCKGKIKNELSSTLK